MDSILSNNSTDDHCREFVRLGGLEPLITILGLPNLPLDFVSSPACQSVSGVCKSVLVSDTTGYKSYTNTVPSFKGKSMYGVVIYENYFTHLNFAFHFKCSSAV